MPPPPLALLATGSPLSIGMGGNSGMNNGIPFSGVGVGAGAGTGSGSLRRVTVFFQPHLIPL